MDHDPLLARLGRVPGLDALAARHDVDLADDGQLDTVAGLLLQRFRREADGEAFTLLYELTHARLVQIAAGLARRLCPSLEPEDLAAAFMVRLFTDTRRTRSAAVRRFLALAHVSMRNEVLDHLRRLRRARAGAPHYRDTLPPPCDPAEAAAHAEQDALLERYGRRLVATVGRCFAQLPPRDQRVLVAREILGLSYERVAAALQLEPGQVGMIIRRARQHLADRLVLRLTARTGRRAVAGEPADARAPLDGAQAEVLRRLLCRDRFRHVPPLVARMLDLSALAARRRLADLVYELAKACLLAAPGATERLLVAAAPRPASVVAGDVRALTTRLRGVPADEPPPEPDLSGDALADARRCLDVLLRLEGNSGRQQVALALVHVHAGEPELAEALLRPLLDAELPALTRQNVVRNLTLALVRQRRFHEARALALDAAGEWPDDPVRLTNLCTCAARLADRPAFDQHVRALLATQRRAPHERVRAWIDGVLPGLAAGLGLPGDHLARLAGDPGASGGTRG